MTYIPTVQKLIADYMGEAEVALTLINDCLQNDTLTVQERIEYDKGLDLLRDILFNAIVTNDRMPAEDEDDEVIDELDPYCFQLGGSF